jgi:energy-coupling factor transporter ATP-binding protein EcfA2
MRLFQDLHRQGMTVVIVTHDPNIAGYAERVVSFQDGVIVSDEKRAAKDNDANEDPPYRDRDRTRLASEE